MTTRIVTAPAYYPVTLAEAKDWCRIDADLTDQDAAVRMLIAAATKYAENLTGRAFIPRALQTVLPCWPTMILDHCRVVGIELPFAPLRSVLSITYIDDDGDEQTLAADQYVVHNWREPGFIVPAWQVTWPSHRAVPDAVRVNFLAGYAGVGSPEDEAGLQAGIPANLKLWLEARCSTYNEFREQLSSGNVFDLPKAYVDGLLDDLVLASRLV